MDLIKNFWKKNGIWFCLAIGLLFGLYRLRYFVGADIPLGYDPGMYKGIFAAYSNILRNFDFSQLPSWIRHEPLLGVIMGIIGKVGGGFDWWLTRGIGIINLIPGVLLFLLLKKENKRMGVIAACLYWLSIVQYQLFWWGYFKQAIAVNILLLILIFIQRKNLWLQGILFFLLIILHKHTALYTGAILVGYTIIKWRETKKFPRQECIVWTTAGILAMICYIPLWNQIIPGAIKATQTTFGGIGTGGDFMTKFMYTKTSWLIIVLSLVGLRQKLKDGKFDLVIVGYLVGIIWIGLGLVNFNRTLVFLDIFVIILASYALLQFYLNYKKFGLYIVSLVLLSIGINYIVHINNNSYPLINNEEFVVINDLTKKIEINAIIMNTHRNYTPWIMGWSQRDYVSPGMSDLDNWSHSDWNHWRSVDGVEKCNMLKNTYQKLNRPMYIWIGEQQIPENFLRGKCFLLIDEGNTWDLWKINF